MVIGQQGVDAERGKGVECFWGQLVDSENINAVGLDGATQRRYVGVAKEQSDIEGLREVVQHPAKREIVTKLSVNAK